VGELAGAGSTGIILAIYHRRVNWDESGDGDAGINWDDFRYDNYGS